jgi:hypothetical protein
MSREEDLWEVGPGKGRGERNAGSRALMACLIRQPELKVDRELVGISPCPRVDQEAELPLRKDWREG